MRGRTLSETERVQWLRLIRTSNVGPVTFFELLKRFDGDAGAAADALPDLSAKAGRKRRLKPPPLSEATRELEAASKLGARVVAACEPAYPAPLAALDPPPPILTILGDETLFERTGVAIVGARNASAVGRKMAQELSSGLGRKGFVIVSGLARGIDGEAHAAALDTGTIAVLAGGVDQIYPPEHDRLYAAIAEQGAIVSEAPLGYTATARDFPKRNRIVTGLSLGVVVVEAAQRSGTLISARTALEQGREVMAVPGSPLDPRAKGSNHLLKQGAWLVESVQDVLDALEGATKPALREMDEEPYEADDRMVETPPALIEAIADLLSPTPISLDELSRMTDTPARLIAAAVMELELAGRAV
ncbi:MAG: DNA-processing protein DprA, partial [Pseudomonadota bacterium]